MNFKKSTLAATVAGVLALGAASNAAASVYAGSRLLVQNLSVLVTEDGVTPAPGATITGFQFTATNTATLNGVSALQTATCGGLPSPGGVLNDCNALQPRLDPTAANAPGGTIVRLNNNYNFFGPGANQYANSDSVIDTAELTLDPSTAARQIAEAELQNGNTASANAEIQSSTGFVFQFTVAGGAANQQLILNLEADPNLMVAINQAAPPFVSGNAQANVNSTFTLTNDNTGDQVTASPQGTPATNNCDVDAGLALAGVSCVETADTEDLNRNLSTSLNPNAIVFSDGRPANNVSPDLGFTPFGIIISGLFDGDWTFAFNAITSVQLRQTQVPEPATLALLGAGLLGLGATRRRAKA